MKKNMIFTLAAAAVFTLCAQDSVTEFKKGTGQLNARKYAAAAETFDKIAQTSSGEFSPESGFYFQRGDSKIPIRPAVRNAIILFTEFPARRTSSSSGRGYALGYIIKH